MRLFAKVMLALTGIVSLASIAGVAATWTYARNPALTVEKNVPISMGTYIWEGSDDIHGGTGEDHKQLLDSMIADLNSSDSVLEKQIDARLDKTIFKWNSWDTYGSMDVYDDTDLSEFFDLDTQGLEFLMYFPEKTPNIRYIFTTSVELGGSGWFDNNSPTHPIGTNIYPIYRTTLVKNDSGEWEGVITELGFAPSKFYDNDIAGSGVIKCPSFNAERFTVGKLGTSTDNAIYAYVGLSTTAYVDSETEQTYYALNSLSDKTQYTITSTNENCLIEIIYDNEVVKSGTTSVSFTTVNKVRDTYYIRLSGAKDMPFTIS